MQALCRAGWRHQEDSGTAAAQAFAHLLPSLYQFRELEADLAMAGAEPPPDAVLAAYRVSAKEWSALMAEARPALDKQVGLRFDVIPSLAEAERGLKVVRRAQAAAMAIDDALLTALTESVASRSDAASTEYSAALEPYLRPYTVRRMAGHREVRRGVGPGILTPTRR